ncbi:MerR family transcriptional regulator [Micromonospora sp. NBC_01699]|uniref:MerR family transcriptional regulator n=1 Tax=Micromonospora sp. NBC_01699 TaxID=2975984 RepID=UPI002E29F02B|nr:MerR family transcriptional regulator [Micromonospora sp. NBC_01699]
MTIDRFAAEVCLTPRTIRSYHTRGLLQPPARIGRTPYYDRSHLTRMRNVAQLQGQGLPLEAIRALLDPDLVLGQFILPAATISSVLRTNPDLMHALTNSGVLIRRPDGAFAVFGVRAVLAARAASRPETPLTDALRVLADAVTAVQPLAEGALSRVRAELLRRVPGGSEQRQELLDLTVEAVRIGLWLQEQPTG